MMRRKRLSRRKSKKMFRKTSDRTHVKNFRGSPMRGGIRL